MVQTSESGQTRQTEKHLDKFERFEKETKSPPWMFPLRKAGMARFAELGFPTTRQEDWRFTNVAPIAKLPFKPAFEPTREAIDPEVLGNLPLGELPAFRLVFVNGHFSPNLSSTETPPGGAVITSLAKALETNEPALEKHLARYANQEQQPFTALNTAFFQDGAFIKLPKDLELEKPVHLLYISTAKEPGTTYSPRNLIIADHGSRATVFESYHSAREAACLTNTVTELVVGDGVNLEHCKFQDESLASYHIAALHADIGRNSNVIWHSISTGARLARNNIRTVLAGEGLECTLNGLYLTRADQLADHHMVVEHAQPHCASHEYFNGILDGRSKGVFHGRILVRPAAQKTDAKQTNKNLLLSDDATVDTKPQLEIYADDVKCTHGATIGQLNEDSIFYLRARGIGMETARRMLIHSFAGEIIERIRHRPLRDALDKIVWDRLEANPHVAGHK
jgi:Fe-S cluster assembly protein SufD